jgi:hypothetical protein
MILTSIFSETFQERFFDFVAARPESDRLDLSSGDGIDAGVASSHWLSG